MEQLHSAVLSICLLSICTAVCTLFCPESSLTKQVRFLISLLFIIGLAVPLTNLEFPESLIQIQEQNSQETALAVTKKSAEQALLFLLSEEQIHCSDLQVDVHIDGNQRIMISDVSVVCDDYQNACRVLREALGEETELHVTEILE